ncbi:MAG: hypothetical protein ACRDJT_14970, partial [Actinomycetota bacterium]
VRPDQEQHLARRQRTGASHEVDIEPSWAVEAALDSKALVDDGRSRTGLSIRVIGLGLLLPGGGRRPTRRCARRIPGACCGTTRRTLADGDCIAGRTATTTDPLVGTR